MGLDNGIVIRRIKKENLLKFPNFIKCTAYNEDTNDNSYCVEIAYWRKCWGIRQVIIDTFHLDADNANYVFDKEDISILIKELIPFLSKEYWEENSDSIWEFEDYVENMLQILLNLKWLETYWQENPDIKVEFYDSY